MDTGPAAIIAHTYDNIREYPQVAVSMPLCEYQIDGVIVSADESFYGNNVCRYRNGLIHLPQSS